MRKSKDKLSKSSRIKTVYNCKGQCVSDSQSTFEELNLKNRITTDISNFRKAPYICPMRCEGDKTYPEPGDCPVCGMHLEQILTFGMEHKSEDDDFNSYKKMVFRFIIAVIFTIPVLIIAMSGLVPRLPQKINLFLQFILSFPVIIFSAGFIFQKGFKSIMTGN